MTVINLPPGQRHDTPLETSDTVVIPDRDSFNCGFLPLQESTIGWPGTFINYVLFGDWVVKIVCVSDLCQSEKRLCSSPQLVFLSRIQKQFLSALSVCGAKLPLPRYQLLVPIHLMHYRKLFLQPVSESKSIAVVPFDITERGELYFGIHLRDLFLAPLKHVFFQHLLLSQVSQNNTGQMVLP